MDKNMKIDVKILNELRRYNSINKYITEQDAAALPPPPADDAAAGALPPPPDAGAEGAIPPPDAAAMPGAPVAPDAMGGGEPIAEPIDITSDPDVEKLDDKGKDNKELEITDLVKSQKNVEKKQEEYFEQLFGQLTSLEDRLGEMDNIVNKLNSLEAKVEKYRTKTPEEKMKLRSLDSGPFDQTLSQYFDDNEEKFDKQGKDEYILTQDEVEDYSPSDVRKSFRDFENNKEPDNFKRIQ
jgi:hypothetical protein